MKVSDEERTSWKSDSWENPLFENLDQLMEDRYTNYIMSNMYKFTYTYTYMHIHCLAHQTHTWLHEFKLCSYNTYAI